MDCSAERPIVVSRAARAFRPCVIAAITTAAILRSFALTRSVAVMDRVFVLDDTYYTLSIARSLSQGHGPSASAHTLTSGFQPLIAFILVPCYTIFHGLNQQLWIGVAFTLLSDVILVGALGLLVRRLFGPLAGILAAAIWALSPTAYRYGATGLETSLALLVDVLLVLAWLWQGQGNDAVRRATWVGVIGGLAILARIDALALVVCILAIQTFWRPRIALRMAVACGLTLAPWWLWCTVTFGSPLPQSGFHLLDRGWSGTSTRQMMAIVGANLLPGPFSTASPLQGGWYQQKTVWPFLFAVAVGLILGVRWLRASLWHVPRAEHTSGSRERHGAQGALVAFALAIVAFYTWFPVRWFTYRYIAPAVLVATILIAYGLQLSYLSIRRKSRSRARFGALAAVLIMASILGPQLIRLIQLTTPISNGLWSRPSATALVDSDTGWAHNAIAVSDVLPQHAIIGAQQSGALGWYASERSQEVVNLDGVVNPNVSGFHDVRGICREIRKRDVRYFADFESLGTWLANSCRPYGVKVAQSPLQIVNPDRDLRIQRVTIMNLPLNH